MWWGHHGLGVFPFIFFPLGWFLLMVLCFIGVRAIAFRRFCRWGRGSCEAPYAAWNKDRDPEAILKRRLASGEISEEEYKRLRDVLKP